jgi:hypothetical protein
LIASPASSVSGWLRRGAGRQLAGDQIQDGSQVKLALIGRDLGHVATPLQGLRRGEVAAKPIRELRCGLVLLGCSLAALRFPTLLALSSHRVGDGVHTHRPAGLDEIGMWVSHEIVEASFKLRPSG